MQGQVSQNGCIIHRIFVLVAFCLYLYLCLVCVSTLTAQTINFSAPTLAGQTTHSIYYLNNNISPAGYPLAGQINPNPFPADGGPVEFGSATPPFILNTFNTASDGPGNYGAKSVCFIGGKIFFTGDDRQGIRRIDDWSGTNLSGFVAGTVPGTESICTDGTFLYGNDEVVKNQIYKWNPTLSGPLVLSPVGTFPATVGPTGGYVRGISFFDWSTASGDEYIYCSNGGDPVTVYRSIFAVNTTTGTATQIAGISVPGTEAVYGVIAWRNPAGCTFLMAITATPNSTTGNGYIYVWQLATPTQVINTTPQTLDKAALGQTAEGGNFYGISAVGSNAWLIQQYKLYRYAITGNGISPTPVATAATTVTCTSFVANWNPLPGINHFQIEVADNSAFAPITTTLNVPGTAIQTTITGLTAGTTYYYRIRSDNGCAISVNSNVISLTTASTALPPTVSPASAISCTSFTANWNPISGATGYRIDVATDAAFSAIIPAWNNIFVAGTSKQITGLTPNTTYYYRVRAETPCGTTANSTSANLTTLIAPAIPNLNPTAAITCTTFTVSWAPVPAVTGYRLDVATAASFAPGTLVPGYANRSVPATTEIVTGLVPSTTYYYRVRSENSCGASANSVITAVTTTPPIPPPFNISTSGATAFCVGDSVLLSVPVVSGANYQWTRDAVVIPGATTATLKATVAGVYAASMSNVCGTTNSSNTITVSVAPVPGVPTVPTVAPICSGSNTSITVAGSNIEWFVAATGGAPIFAGNTYTTPALTDTTIYYVRFGGICPGNRVPITVPVAPIPQPRPIRSNGSTIICTGSSVLLETDVQPNVNYRWLRDGSPVGTNAPQLTVTTPGNYRLEFYNACTTVAAANAIDVIVETGLSAAAATIGSAGPTQFCPGGSVRLSVSPVPNVTYQWYVDGLPLGTDPRSSEVIATAPGIYTVTLTNACGSVTSSPGIVVEHLGRPAPPTISSDSGEVICEGSSTRLSVTDQPAVSYQWLRDSTVVGSGPSINVSEAGVYSVLVTNNCGTVRSSNTVSIVLAAPLPPTVITTEGDTAGCAPDSLLLKVTPSPGAGYQWIHEDTLIRGARSAVFRPILAGNYRVIVKNPCGTDTAKTGIIVKRKPDPPLITADGSVNFCPGDSVALRVAGNASLSYQWYWYNEPIGKNEPVLYATAPGPYTIVLENTCGRAVSANTITVGEIQTPIPYIKEIEGRLFAYPVNELSYQWLDSVGNPVPGGIFQKLIPPAPGLYRVKISYFNGCTRISGAFAWPEGRYQSIQTDFGKYGSPVIYPNPMALSSRQVISVLWPAEIPPAIELQLTTVLGQPVANPEKVSTNQYLIPASVGAGVYALRIFNEEAQAVYRIVIQP